MSSCAGWHAAAAAIPIRVFLSGSSSLHRICSQRTAAGGAACRHESPTEIFYRGHFDIEVAGAADADRVGRAPSERPQHPQSHRRRPLREARVPHIGQRQCDESGNRAGSKRKLTAGDLPCTGRSGCAGHLHALCRRPERRPQRGSKGGHQGGVPGARRRVSLTSGTAQRLCRGAYLSCPSLGFASSTGAKPCHLVARQASPPTRASRVGAVSRFLRV